MLSLKVAITVWQVVLSGTLHYQWLEAIISCKQGSPGPGWWGIQFGENIVGRIRPQLLSRWEMGVHKHKRWISKDMWEDQEQSLNICEIKFCHCRTLCKKSFRIPEELSYHSKLRFCVPLWSHLTWGLQQKPSILKKGRTLLWFVYWKLILCWI